MWEALAWAAAILAAIAAAVGLFGSSIYRDAAFWSQQAQGIDLATLFLATPILVVSLFLLSRGWAPARALAIGVLLYFVYNYAIYTTSVAMNRLAGLYIATLGLSVWALVLIVTSVSTVSVTIVGSSAIGRVIGIYLVLVVVLFGLLWLSQIASTTVSGVPPPDLTRSAIPANPVYALDLAIFLPLAAVAAIGLLLGLTPAANFAVPMLLWVFLTSAGIVGGFLFASRAGEQISVAVATLVITVGIVALVLTGLALASGSKAIA